MKLNFLGNGSGFAKTHTGAYFINKNDLIIIDCSMLNIHKILELGIEKFENVYLLITHMHDDHVSGLGLFIQYIFYIYKNKLKLFIPTELVEDINLELKIKGIPDDIYNIINLDKINKFDWFITKIKTSHSPELEGKCFGYKLKIDGKIIVYSGDTNVLDVYENHLKDCDEFYVDVSALYGKVHLIYVNVEEKLLFYIKKYELDVYIMHIDNEEVLRNIIHNDIKIAEIKQN